MDGRSKADPSQSEGEAAISIAKPLRWLLTATLGCLVLSGLAGGQSQPDGLRIVGSSTVFPFSAKVAEVFTDRTGVGVIVEQTGSGGGHKLFCEGIGEGTPDATNSSRPQKPSEYERCRQNGVDDVIEIKIGYDGIVLARSRDARPMILTLEQLYRALAQTLPDDRCRFVPNPNTLWSDISPYLPDERIEVYGPPPTSGTRDAFVETAMEAGARSSVCLQSLETTDPSAFRVRAHTLREDGGWIDSGENDNAIVQTLSNTPSAIGVLGFSFLDQNRDRIRGIPVDGVRPEFVAIRDGDYPIVRSLYLYLKGAHIRDNPALAEYALEFTSDRAARDGGYLGDIGLIPTDGETRDDVRQRLETALAIANTGRAT